MENNIIRPRREIEEKEYTCKNCRFKSFMEETLEIQICPCCDGTMKTSIGSARHRTTRPMNDAEYAKHLEGVLATCYTCRMKYKEVSSNFPKQYLNCEKCSKKLLEDEYKDK